MYRIEHRVGIAAPVDDAYEIAADLENWPQWSPIHKRATGTLKFGSPIALEEYYEGLGTWEQTGALADWQPFSHIHIAVPKPFYAGTLVRYFEFDSLSVDGSTFAVGALFHGFLAEREGRMIAPPVRRGFAAFAEALKARAEAAYLARPESERSANYLPPKAIADKLQPPPKPNWKGPRFLGQKEKSRRGKALIFSRRQSYLKPMIDELYSREILRRTTQLQHVGRLAKPQASAERVAKLCGSTIHVDLNMDGDTVSDFAQEVQACALGQASAAILSQSVVGATAGEVFAARDGLRGLLKGQAADFPERFKDFAILASVKDFPARHASTLLALEATSAAISSLQPSETS